MVNKNYILNSYGAEDVRIKLSNGVKTNQSINDVKKIANTGQFWPHSKQNLWSHIGIYILGLMYMMADYS